MITIIVTSIFTTLTYLFGLFPSFSFDLSNPIGQAFEFIGGYSDLLPQAFQAFFRQLYVGNILIFVFIFVSVMLRIFPLYKRGGTVG